MRAPATTSPNFHPMYREVDPMFNPMYHAVRILVGFTQGLFRYLPEGKYKWSPDPEKSEIMITDLMPITSQSITQRPAILTMMGQASFTNSAMRSVEGVNPSTGHTVFRDLITSSVTFNCISRNGVEAGRLAWFLASHIKSLRIFLQRTGPFARIGHDVILLGEQPAGLIIQDQADGGAVNVPVSVPFLLAHKWEVREPASLHETTRVNLQSEEHGGQSPITSYTIQH